MYMFNLIPLQSSCLIYQDCLVTSCQRYNTACKIRGIYVFFNSDVSCWLPSCTNRGKYFTFAVEAHPSPTQSIRTQLLHQLVGEPQRTTPKSTAFRIHQVAQSLSRDKHVAGQLETQKHLLFQALKIHECKHKLK